jgi:hypothetical protein
MSRFGRIGVRMIFAAAIFAALTTAILTRPEKTLTQFDQPQYFTVVSDMIRYGVYSNGWFANYEPDGVTPKPGMFYGPLYPLMIFAAAKADPRFAAAVLCGADMWRGKRPYGSCDVYLRPMLLINALLLTLGALAVARAAELLFGGGRPFWLTGAIATAALAAEADQFSFAMTEATTFALFSLTMLAMVLAWTGASRRHAALAGVALGLLCLTRFSFLVVALLLPLLIAINARFVAKPRRGSAAAGILAFALAFVVVVLPWAVRNAISVGKFGLTEEYGAHALVERFAYDRMTPREFALAFPYCLPAIGPPMVDAIFGPQAMSRFDYETKGSFYDIGSLERFDLIARHQRLDPIIGRLFLNELKENGWRYVLVSVPLAWCGMWTGGWLALLLVPMFAVACVAAWRRSQPLFLLYALPALAMLALHALLANFYTRYNLILIAPFSVAAAWLVLPMADRVRSRLRAPAPSR